VPKTSLGELVRGHVYEAAAFGVQWLLKGIASVSIRKTDTAMLLIGRQNHRVA
jgi:hypothetical protein